MVIPAPFSHLSWQEFSEQRLEPVGGWDPLPFEDVGGGLVTYVDSDELEEHQGIQLRVYVPQV